MDHQKRTIIVLLIIVAVCISFYTQFTLFVIQPIGALPEGKTLLISRMDKTNFIDSPDAMCERLAGGVSLLCRGMMMGAIAEKAVIFVRLPYSEWLYKVSTDGKEYGK